MSGNKQGDAGGTSLPDDIAAESGLPRVDEIGRSLHYIDQRVGEKARERAAQAGEWVDDARDAVEDTAHEAGEATDDAVTAARGRLKDATDGVRDRAYDAYDDVRGWAADRYDAQRSRAADFADRGYRRIRRSRSATEDFVSDNPLLVGVVGLAAGLLLGALLPRTRREADTLGPWADEVRDQGLRYARDVTQQGRAFVERVLDPDNLDAAVRDSESYQGEERTAHRL